MLRILLHRRKEGTDTMEEDLKNSMTRTKSIRFLLRQGRMVLADTQNIDIMSQMLPNVSKASQSLDVSVLHTLILEKSLELTRKIWQNRLTLHTQNSLQRQLTELTKASSNAHLYSTLQELPKFVMLPPQEKNAAEIHIFLSKNDYRYGNEQSWS